MTTLSEKTAGLLLKVTMWILIVFASAGVLNWTYQLLSGAKFRVGMLIAAWCVYAGIMVLRRDNGWRKSLMVYCLFVTGFFLYLAIGSLLKTGTVFPAGFHIGHKVIFLPMLLWNVWTFLLLWHPAVKRLFTDQKPGD